MAMQRTHSAALGATQTHGIPSFQNNRLLVDSRGRGWRHLYASITAEQPWAAELRPLPHDCLVYCVSGQAEIEREVDTIGPSAGARLRPRGISLIPAGVASRWQVTGTPDILLVYLHAELKAQLARDLGLNAEAATPLLNPLLAESDTLLEQICVALMRCLRNGSRHGTAPYVEQLARTALMHLLVSHAAEQSSAGHEATNPGELSHALAYIEACLGDDLPIATLARVAGVSEAHFTRLFVQRVGMPPHRYILSARVERAKTLLAGTRKPITQIASELGFATQSHFASAFRRLAGVTPSAYRKAC